MTDFAPIPPQDLDAEEIAWATGLFEGEGSFGIRSNSTVLLSLASTDRDVIERWRAIAGSGVISFQEAGRNNRMKRLWRVDIAKVDEVLRVVALLYPRLGERRRARADEVVQILTSRIEEATAVRTCPGCKRDFRPPFAPNAKRKKFCSIPCYNQHYGRAKKVAA